jgi:hypothetical protein
MIQRAVGVILAYIIAFELSAVVSLTMFAVLAPHDLHHVGGGHGLHMIDGVILRYTIAPYNIVVIISW